MNLCTSIIYHCVVHAATNMKHSGQEKPYPQTCILPIKTHTVVRTHEQLFGKLDLVQQS